MKLKDIGEFGLIEKISKGCLIRQENIIKAIGDDAAAFVTDPGMVFLVTTDLFVERIHFLRQATTGFNLGYKSLAVNLSDIAAMGGVAREAFVSIAVPDDCPIDFIEDIYKGMKTLARRFDVNILGGDTTGSKIDLIINVVVTGEVEKDGIRCRDRAKPGDRIACTGFLGDSRAGLYLILNNITSESPAFSYLFHTHILPEPHLGQGRFLSSEPGVHACIDVSDGLSSDLWHIVTQSRVGARIFAEKMPISKPLFEFCTRFDFDPVSYALSGGEDYVLVCTLSPECAHEIAEKFMKQFGSPLYLIGEITESGKMMMIRPDGREEPFRPSGWDHFKGGGLKSER